MTHPLGPKLRGETINCSCHAYGASECGCDSDWPEHFCKEAADELDRLVKENELWVPRPKADSAGTS
jgi:hypothetical protein